MMQSVSNHYSLSTSHVNRQIMLHVLANSEKAQISDIKTAIILIKFLVNQNKINTTIFKRLID